MPKKRTKRSDIFSGDELATLKCEVHDPNVTTKTKDPRLMKKPPQILVRGCGYAVAIDQRLPPRADPLPIRCDVRQIMEQRERSRQRRRGAGQIGLVHFRHRGPNVGAARRRRRRRRSSGLCLRLRGGGGGGGEHSHSGEGGEHGAQPLVVAAVAGGFGIEEIAAGEPFAQLRRRRSIIIFQVKIHVD